MKQMLILTCILTLFLPLGLTGCSRNKITSLKDRHLSDMTYGHQRMVSIAVALMAQPGIWEGRR